MRGKIEVIEYTDPYCTWCWGVEPVLRRIQEAYEDRVVIGFRMGGLVEDIREFYDPFNDIGGENWYRQVAEHWLEASRGHGMPVDERIWYDIKNEFRSTYPASIAYKAAELQDADLAKRFLRRMREAAAAERQAIHRPEVQAALAREVGLDHRRLIKDIESGRAEKAFRRDLFECRSRGITGFPTFLLRSRDSDKEVLLRGYQPFEVFELAFRELVGGDLKPRKLEARETSIFAFILKHGKAAPREVAEVFSLPHGSAMKRLSNLEEKGLLMRQRAGNGFFYLPQNRWCGADAGSCPF